MLYFSETAGSIKVLHVFKTYLPDGFAGVERVIWELAQGSARHGIESQVFFLSRTPEQSSTIAGNHRVHAAPITIDLASTPISLSAWGRYRRLAREADILHYHFPWPMMDLLHLLAGGVGRPSIVTYHSDIVRQARLAKFYAPLRDRFLGSMDRIVATSPNYRVTSEVLARHASRTSVIPIGIDPTPLQPDPDLLEVWRQRLPERFFLFVGALRYYKGLGFLIEAARRTGLPVVIAGGGQLPDALRPLPKNVTLLGPVSDADKACLLHLAESFVFPSHLRSEAFGVALLEAAFCGNPLISCEIGTGTSFINQAGETGLTVAPADAQALSQAMVELWENEGKRIAFGCAARRRAHALFQAEQMVADYCRLYRQVLAEHYVGSASAATSFLASDLKR